MSELFSERLTRLRQAKRLSSRALAELVGVEHRSILRIEWGETKPRLDSLSAIARHLGVSIDYLVTGREPAHVAALHRAIRAKAPYDRLAAFLPGEVEIYHHPADKPAPVRSYYSQRPARD